MLSAEQVLTEPARRNTAPCVAYATYKLYTINFEAIVVVTPSDQYIKNETIFEEIIKRNLAYAALNDSLVTIGITPTYPATGYGYIELSEVNKNITHVKSFREKPEFERAKEFIDSGHFVWNSGMFIWSLQSIIKSLKTYLPDIANAFFTIESCYNTPEEQTVVNETYLACRSISIDYGVMEKATNVYVSCADFGWSDIGSWHSLYDLLEKDVDNNVISADTHCVVDVNDCMIKESNTCKRIVIQGVENLLIVDTDDVLMICRKDENLIRDLIKIANV
jgi:mannose-1-phosphate guanylyltransferase